jgi:predicted esterase
MTTPSVGVHQSHRVVVAGTPLRSARAALILTHGRGATADSILPLAEALEASDFALFAPQAEGNTWYPYSFLSEIERNEPGISSGIRVLADLVESIENGGIPAERIALLGFSQGACLTLEFTARHARRFGAVIGFSGGLIGPDGTPRDYAGSLGGTPVFLGCSDVDGHIPLARVRHTAEVLQRLGAAVDERIYPGMDHTINADEIRAAHDLLATLGKDDA